MKLPTHPLLVALQFLTTIPIHLKTPPEGRLIARSVLYYPLVGALIGGILAFSMWLANQLQLSSSPLLVAALFTFRCSSPGVFDLQT